MFRNVDNCYEDAAGRIIHIPSEKGRATGLKVRQLLAGYRFDRHYRHLGGGGPIAVLHRHRPQAFFATADIADCFGSIPRNRVAAALRQAGVREHRHFANWSTVRAEGGGYVIPFGFPASVHLATLVIQESPLGAFLRAATHAVTVQVYLDDISLSSSSDDAELLVDVYNGLLEAMEDSGFGINLRKSSPPSPRVELFNCVLEQGRSEVSEARRAAFDAGQRTGLSAERFQAYCQAVARGNRRQDDGGWRRSRVRPSG